MSDTSKGKSYRSIFVVLCVIYIYIYIYIYYIYIYIHIYMYILGPRRFTNVFDESKINRIRIFAML